MWNEQTEVDKEPLRVFFSQQTGVKQKWLSEAGVSVLVSSDGHAAPFHTECRFEADLQSFAFTYEVLSEVPLLDVARIPVPTLNVLHGQRAALLSSRGPSSLVKPKQVFIKDPFQQCDSSAQMTAAAAVVLSRADPQENEPSESGESSSDVSLSAEDINRELGQRRGTLKSLLSSRLRDKAFTARKKVTKLLPLKKASTLDLKKLAKVTLNVNDIFQVCLDPFSSAPL
uniref:Uncharacterized protein n=1 Tax=Chromera velia CCMP2878 TaxID=1169474 RepID=A0A0G4HH49_9ALVE|eukprot:Cvel_6838.t1-p1 / transcript=Cvel_6838.t1 / gene=Cvel_6838 / organism=Chromera_velia_CCMP2878 / gene_product=hypothetical protein / transcript_product=hypothetical protein / location=Cvel_scaffold345:10382-12105(-) / protein_length=227 / sequence_SO=supercontig / SO=protein_coding / is_pseudo=false